MSVKVLETRAELIEAYRLRHDEYVALGYLEANQDGLEIDEHDGHAVPFGALDDLTGRVVGTLRMVTRAPRPQYAPLVAGIVADCRDPSVHERVARARADLPSINSPLVAARLRDFNTDDLPVVELSRTVVRPGARGLGFARQLLELGLSQARSEGECLVIGSCLPEHVPFYARFGYELLPGTGIDLNPTVEKMAVTMVGDTRAAQRRQHEEEARPALLAAR